MIIVIISEFYIMVQGGECCRERGFRGGRGEGTVLQKAVAMLSRMVRLGLIETPLLVSQPCRSLGDSECSRQGELPVQRA